MPFSVLAQMVALTFIQFQVVRLSEQCSWHPFYWHVAPLTGWLVPDVSRQRGSLIFKGRAAALYVKIGPKGF